MQPEEAPVTPLTGTAPEALSTPATPDSGNDLVGCFLGVAVSSRFIVRADLLALLVYAILCAVYFVPLLGDGRVLSVADGDVALEWWWKRGYLGESLRAFRLPQWNPYMMSGTPFLASNQTAIFYPPNWLLALLPLGFVLNAQMIVHFWMGLASMHVLARRLGRTLPGASVAALVFGFSGFAVLHWWQGHLVFVCELPWTPLVVWGWVELLAAVERRSRVPWTGLFMIGGCLALQFLAGHPQIVYFTILIIAGLHAGWVVYCLLKRRTSLAVTTTVWLGAAALFATMLMAVQALPTWLYAPFGVRGKDLPRSYYVFGSQLPQDMLTAVAPWAFGGKPDSAKFFCIDNYAEVAAFVGITAALLAVASLVVPRRTPPILWAGVALILFSWPIALGRHALFFDFAFRYLPGMQLFRCPARILFIVTFAIAILSAAGFDYLSVQEVRDRRSYKRAVGFLIALLCLSVMAFLVIFREGSRSPLFISMVNTRAPEHAKRALTPQLVDALFQRYWLHVLTAAIVGFVAISAITLLSIPRLRRPAQGCILALLFLELAVFAWAYRTSFRPAQFEWPADLRAALQPVRSGYRLASSALLTDFGQGMRFHVRHLSGYEASVPARYLSVISASQELGDDYISSPWFPVERVTPITNALGFRYLLMTADGPQAKQPWEKRGNFSQWCLYENRGALSRATIVETARHADASSVTTAATARDFQSTAIVLVEGDLPPASSPSSLESDTATTSAGELRMLQDDPEEIRAEVLMRRAGWFVLMDQWLPGWRGTVDGAAAPLLRANGMGRAVRVASGKHIIRMIYCAPGLMIGAITSGIGWLVWLAIAIRCIRSRRTHRFR